MYNTSVLFFTVLCLVTQVCAATPPRPVIRPYLMSYTQMRADLRRDTVMFKQEKVIFGMNINLNERWSARVGIDLIGMKDPALKPAALTYQKDRWKIDAGIFVPSGLDLAMSEFWANRFIERVAADVYLLDPTADLGVRVAYRWNEFLSTDFSLVTGNGYQHLKVDKHPMPAFRILLAPVKQLTLGGYISMRKIDVIETGVNGFAHLQIENKWKMTGEYHHKANYHFKEGQQIDVVSFYSTCFLSSWLSVLGRYDVVWSNKTGASGEAWHVQGDGQALIGGVTFQCFPSVRLSVDYWNWRSAARLAAKEDRLYVCIEFKY